MLIIDMNLPTDFDTHKEQFWIEFPSPWPDNIVSGTLECLTTSNFEVQGCTSVDGVAAEHVSSRIHIGGIRSSTSRPLNGIKPDITGTNHKLMIRGIVNPPNEN